jgi:hypothetical protein
MGNLILPLLNNLAVTGTHCLRETIALVSCMRKLKASVAAVVVVKEGEDDERVPDVVCL